MLLFYSTLLLECKDYIILVLQDELPIGLHIQHGEDTYFFKFFHLQLVMSNNKKNEEDEDVLGHMLWDYFHHKDSFAITERNDGLIDPEDPQI
jgi:hypothetical protein